MATSPMSMSGENEGRSSWNNRPRPADVDTDEKYKNTVRLAKGLAAHNMRQLPEGYELGEYDIICGRGRKCFNHIGNQRFRQMVADMLPKYSDAAAKLEKTYIICEVVNTVRRSSPNGGFVKKDPATGRYFEVGDFLAREKTSQAFRDALHDQYKSSNAAKKKRRMEDQAQKLHRQNSAPSLNHRAIQESGLSNSSDRMLRNASSFDDYATNNSKFMRVDRADDLLLGELETNLNISFNSGSVVENKRRLFASQKSATSIIDEANQSQSSGAWFNRSCPNLARPASSPRSMRPQLQDVVEEEEPLDAYSKPALSGTDWHHSQPNLFDPNTLDVPMVACGKPNLFLNRMRANKRSQSVRHLNTRIGSSFDMLQHPAKTSTTVDPFEQDDIILSPIGDGSLNGLTEKLKGLIDDSNDQPDDNMFDPIPF